MLTPGKAATVVAVALTIPAVCVVWAVTDLAWPHVARAVEALREFLDPDDLNDTD